MQAYKQALIDHDLPDDNQAMVDKQTEANRRLAALIAEAIKESGLPGKIIADLCGVTPQAVSGWKTTGRISKDTLGKLALVVKKPLSYFLHELQDEADVDPGPDIVGKPKLLPVVGRVQAGPDGLLTIDDYPVGHGDGFVEYWASCDQAYALRIRGESMSPRYLPGEFVAVDPCSEVQPNHEVIVLLRDQRRLIKRLMWMNGEQAAFESINKNFPNIIFEREEIEGLHRVIGRVPPEAFKPPL